MFRGEKKEEETLAGEKTKRPLLAAVSVWRGRVFPGRVPPTEYKRLLRGDSAKIVGTRLNRLRVDSIERGNGAMLHHAEFAFARKNGRQDRPGLRE